MLELRKRADRSGSPLSVVYRDKNGRDYERLPDLNEEQLQMLGVEHISDLFQEVAVWPMAGIELVGDAPELHNFSDTFVGKAVADGYLSFENMSVHATEGYERNPVVTGDAIVLQLDNVRLRYGIMQPPGKYEDETHNEYRCLLSAVEEG